MAFFNHGKNRRITFNYTNPRSNSPKTKAKYMHRFGPQLHQLHLWMSFSSQNSGASGDCQKKGLRKTDIFRPPENRPTFAPSKEKHWKNLPKQANFQGGMWFSHPSGFSQPLAYLGQVTIKAKHGPRILPHVGCGTGSRGFFVALGGVEGPGGQSAWSKALGVKAQG